MSVHVSVTLAASFSNTVRSVGAAGGIVNDATELSAETAVVSDSTRKSYAVLGVRPVTRAPSAPASAVAPDAQALAPVARYSTRNPVSLSDASVHVTTAVVESVARTATPSGGSGAPISPTETTFEGEDNPLTPCFASTRK